MLRKIANIALLGWVGLLLVVPVVAYAFGVRGRNVENRALAASPPFGWETFLHSGAWHQAAAAFSDRLPWRDKAIRLRAEVAFDVFQDSPNPGVVIVGRDRWLFLREEFDVCTAFPTVGPVQVAQAFELADAVAVASGRVFRTVLIPAKSTIESAHYRSRHYSFERCARDREQRLHALLRGRQGVVDLWSTLRSAKRAGTDLWIPNDSHTDTAGSIAIARALVQSVRPSAWQVGLEQSGASYPYVGDLSVLAGIPIRASRHRLVLHGKPRQPIRSPMLALIDSQLEVSDPEILPYFPARQELGIDALLAGQVPPTAIRAAHVLVVESVVRTIYQRVALGFPNTLVDALLPDVQLGAASYASASSTSATLTVPAGATTVSVRAPIEGAASWRLLVLTVVAAKQPTSLALADPHDQPLATPDSARAGLPAGERVALAIPPGVALKNIRLAISAPAGATLSAPRLATLSTGG